MGLPSINQWIDTVANPRGRFRSLGEFDAERDAYGSVRFTAGNNAAVFRVTHGNKRAMLKCYIREDSQRDGRYRFLAEINDSLLAPSRFLSSEAYVYDDLGNGSFRDLVVSEWVEGNTLDVEIKRAGREFGAPRFRELAESFDRLVLELLAREWAHGDLKPENIVITSIGNAVLIDYDAIFVPGMEIRATSELGTPGYQHPARNETHYGPFLDDYPAALISVSLHALAMAPELYAKYYKGEGLILDPGQIMAGTSAAYEETLVLFASRGEYALYELALALKSPTIEIPGLAGVINRYNRQDRPGSESPAPELYESGGLWGYRHTGGETITGPIFENACEFSEGFGVVTLNGIPQVIDTGGRMVVDGRGYEVIKPYGCGRAAFCRAGKWGYLDDAGHEVIPPMFEGAGTMHEGLGAVRIGGKTGFADISGRIMIAPRFDHARGFREGKAEVSEDGETFSIDRWDNRVC